MNKRAIILAGGKGTRLRPYTIAFPKPLMPIGDYPILEVVIRQLAANSFDHITITVNHQAELIKTFFGDGSKWSVKIDYSMEDEPLGTMGPLKLIKDLPDNFLVMNGDILTDLDYASFFEKHQSENNLFTISSYLRSHMVDYGVLKKDNDDILTGFHEKPEKHYEVSMGIYMINKKIVKYIPKGKEFGFDDLMLEMINNKKPVKINNYNGYWLDIGRPDDYIQAIEEFADMSSKFLNE